MPPQTLARMKGGGEHRRGRSMGSTTPRPDNKDEDLALFHEMKRREKHNFLHPSPDDLDVSLSSKFGGMGAPAKKSGTDLLTSDVDKNDYDWLLTPPGTPLFPSLDQEAAALAVISPQASLLNGSSAANSSKLSHSPADPSPKSTRGNPSPRRAGSTTPNGTMSRSRSTPHNSTPVVAAVTRPSTPTSSLTRPSTPTSKSSSTPSVRASTPNLKLSISASKSSSSTASTPTATRPSTPNARSSTPPVRPSTPGARSSTPTSKPSTPTMRRSLSGGRIASPATTRGGPSPKRTTSSRGNSPSAKRVTPIITTVAGMCSEAPPNLRTTVPERTACTPKSSSNGSRTVSESGHASDAMDASGRSRRRPRSPSVSRSFSSSSSQDNRTSSQTSRGSVISSYDDGIEVSRPTLQSSRNSAAGKWHAAGHEDLLSGKANTNVQAKRVTRSLVVSSSGSVSGGTPSKKSLEPNKWQGDAYQHSPSSYRHLMASSPGSPFYGTRANSLLVRPASAMNSSVTTSSNASSEHGTTVAPDTEGSERDDDDLLSWDSYGRRTSPSPRGQQADILMLDKEEEKLGGWQDYERLNSNDLVASYKPGMQSTLDTEVTSFYESDGIASLEMLEQLGVMGEVYNTKKATPGERVLERMVSNIEDGKMELRRSGERPLQRRASNIEDSRIPDLRRSDDGNGHTRAAYNKLGNEGHGNSGQQGSKLKRQELLESLNETRKYDADLLRNTGERVLGSQKSKVSNAEIHAACLFVRDFRVGLAPTQGQEIAPSVLYSSSAPEEEATNTNWVADGGGSIMSRKDFGSVRQTHDFSQQKLKVSGGGNAITQMESKLPRRPQSRGKVGSSESVLSHIQEASSKADVIRLQADEDDNANNSALSVLVDVMERIKHESSQPKYLDLENQVSKTISPTGAVLGSKLYVDSLRRSSLPQTSEIRRGLSYEEIHAMDEVDTPELHDIEEDSLMYDGGKDELELLESLHRSALQKEEVRAMEEEVFYESPKRRFVMPEEAEMSSMEADELHESPKRRCVEVTGDEDVATRDAIVLHGSPSFSHELVELDVTSMNLDDFLRPGKENEMEIEGSDEEEPEILVGSRVQDKEQVDSMLPTIKLDFLPTSELETQQDVADREGEETKPLKSIGVCALQEEDLTPTSAVMIHAPDRVVHVNLSDSEMVVEEEPNGRVNEVEDARTMVIDATRSSELSHQEFDECRKTGETLSEQTDDKQYGESAAVTPDFSHCREEMDKHLDATDVVTNQRTLSEDAGGVSVHQEAGYSSASFRGAADGVSQYPTTPDGEMEESLTPDRPDVPCLEDEGSSIMSVEFSDQGSAMDQPLPLSSQIVVGREDEEGSSSMCVETNHQGSGMDQLMPLSYQIVVGREDEKGPSSMCVETNHQESGMYQPTVLKSQIVVGGTQEDLIAKTHESEGATNSEIVNDVKAVQSQELPQEFSIAATQEAHQEGSVADTVCEGGSAANEIFAKMFVEASEEHQVQVNGPALARVPDHPHLKEFSLHSGDEMEDSQEREAVPDSSRKIESKGVEEPSPEYASHLEENSRSLEIDDSSFVETLNPRALLQEPTSDTLVSRPAGFVSQDVESLKILSEKMDHGSGQDDPGNADSVEISETPSRNLHFSEEAVRDDRTVSNVTGTEALPQSVTNSEMFSSSVSESSLKRHIIEESQSLEYLDTKSVETSDYFEAISEEKLDSQEVSSAYFVERKEVALVRPNVLSSDDRTGMSEVVSKPRSRLSTPLSEMRSASSLCAALEEQLAGLIQKIDSAIEESSKPFISGQQEVMVGKDKLSARTSELLREQEPGESPEPVRSSQEEDLLDMLWAEDDDSAYSEGSGEDEFSLLQESKPSGKDSTPNQVNGEIRLSRSSEKGLTLYSNGHPNEVSLDTAKTSAPVFVEVDGQHMESPKSLLEVPKTDENFSDGELTSHGSLPAGAVAYATSTPSSDEQDRSASDNHAVLDQSDCVEIPNFNDGDLLEDLMDEDGEPDSAPCKEMDADSMVDSSEDGRDASVQDVGVPDHTTCPQAPFEDLAEPVSRDGSPSPTASLSPHELLVVDVPSAGEEGQRLENEISADGYSLGEFVNSVGVSSSSVKEVEGHSAGDKDLVEEKSQDPQAGLTAGPEEVVLAERSEEEDSACEDTSTGDEVLRSMPGLSAKQDSIEYDSFAVGRPHSLQGIARVAEQVSFGEKPASLSIGETAEYHVMSEGPETSKVPSAEQDPLGEELESSQERSSAGLYPGEKGQILEACEVDRVEDSSSCEDIAGYSSPNPEREVATQSSALENVSVGESCEEKVLDEVVALVEEESRDAPAVPGSDFPNLDADHCLVDPLKERIHTDLGENAGLTLGLGFLSSEDGSHRLDEGGVKEDYGEEHLGSEKSLLSPPHESPVPLLVCSGSSAEQSELQSVHTVGIESGELSTVCEIPISAADEDLPKEEALHAFQGSEEQDGQETKVSDYRNSATFCTSNEVEKAVVTDEEDSYQECISHDSSSLSISMGSLVASSEQETYSAGTQGAGDEEQEETSQMQLSSSSIPTGEDIYSEPHPETLPNKSIEDQITICEKIVAVDAPEPCTSDVPLDHSEVGPSTDSSFSVRAHRDEELSSALAKDPEQLDPGRQRDEPIQSMLLGASGNAQTSPEVEAGSVESSSAPDYGLDIGHHERSLISLGESPACTGSSEFSESDEMESVDSPGIEDTSTRVEGQSANIPANKLEVEHSPSVSEMRAPLSDKEDFMNIEDNAWNEQPEEQTSFASSERRWNTAESLRQSENSHTGNGPEQPERQKSLPSSERAWNMNQSFSQSEMSQAGYGVDFSEVQKAFEERVHPESPSAGKEEVTKPSIQNEVPVSEVLSSESATVEAVEPTVNNEGDTPSDAGIADASVGGEKMNGAGSQSAKKLPISKAKSVRTVSLASVSQNDLASEGRLSPDGAVQVPKPAGYTSVTVVSPENLQWEPSTTVPRDTDDSANAGGESGKWNAEGVNSSPASVRRALAYMGQQASSFTPIDTCLQSPPTQVFERDMNAADKDGGVPETKAYTEDMKIPADKSPPKLMLSPVKEMKSMDAPAHSVIEVSSKKDVAPIKAPKAKCSCTIM